MTWAPPECTLPTVERPLRVAEFDALFASALRGQARPGPTQLRLILDGAGQVEATTRDLVARETACCSFFAFTMTRTGDRQLRLDVQVPASRSDVLDAIAARAAAASFYGGVGVSGGLRSGQVAHAAGVSFQTLRYCKRRGLLAPSERTAGRAPVVRAGGGHPAAGHQGHPAAGVHPRGGRRAAGGQPPLPRPAARFRAGPARQAEQGKSVWSRPDRR